MSSEGRLTFRRGARSVRAMSRHPHRPGGAEPLIERLRSAAAAGGQRLWLTGGFVRDALLGRHPKAELDLTVAAPRDLLSALRRERGRPSFPSTRPRETFRIVLRPGAPIAARSTSPACGTPTIEGDLACGTSHVNAVAAELTGGESGFCSTRPAA